MLTFAARAAASAPASPGVASAAGALPAAAPARFMSAGGHFKRRTASSKYKMRHPTVFKRRFKMLGGAGGKVKRMREGNRHRAFHKGNTQKNHLARPAMAAAGVARLLKKFGFASGF